MKRPNILFVFSDQHRFCDLGYAGNPEVETPNLDSLAREGAHFTHAYTSCPLCVPARGTLLTSLHALRHGAAANDMAIKNDCTSVAHVLTGAGYNTAYIGKWHLGGVPRNQFITKERRLGFEYWRGCECNHNYLSAYYDDNDNVRHLIDGYEPITQTNLAIEYMEQQKQSERSWALWLCFSTPHSPYLALPEGEAERYLDRDLTLRPNVQPIRFEDTLNGRKKVPDLKKCYAGYSAHIRQIDIQIGRLIEYLKQNGQYENTIFIYTSDHGDMLGSHGHLNKQLYYDESVRIPFLLFWPGHVPGGRREQLLSIIDISPTLLGLLGLRFENEIDGTDCSRVLQNPVVKGQDFIYSYSYVPCHQAMFREVRSWRAIINQRFTLAADQNRVPICLYDRQNDALQQKNVADAPEYSAIREELLVALDEQVSVHDGYKPWQQLLDEAGRLPEWDRSEEHFRRLWKWYKGI